MSRDNVLRVREAMDVVMPMLRDHFIEKKLLPDEYADYVQEASAAAIDAAIDTGPLDPVDDGFIRLGIDGIYDVLTDAMSRDPHKMRQRASRLRGEGKLQRALRLENRAGRIEARG